MPKEVKAICRHGHKVIIPCNWVKEGLCGIDLKPCRIIEFLAE